jgi:cell division protein FtsL
VINWSEATQRHRPKEEPLRHLRLVPPPDRRRARARFLLVAGIAASTFVALALVYLHVLLAQRQFRLDDLNSQVQKDQATYQELRLQVAQLGAPQHIISMAEGQLHMVQPAKVSYLTPSSYPSGGSLGGATAATTGPKPGTSSPASEAPPGDADWPLVKAQLAGSP